MRYVLNVLVDVPALWFLLIAPLAAQPIRIQATDGLSWSPDGTQLVFAAQTLTQLTPHLLRIPVGGGPVTPLVVKLKSNPDSLSFTHPAWSPDGQYLAFSANPQGNADIFLLILANGRVIQGTTFSDEDTYPIWSPGSDRIAFLSRSAQQPDPVLRILSLEGGIAVDLALTDSTGRAYRIRSNPAWAPDGRHIAVLAVGLRAETPLLLIASTTGEPIRVLSVTDVTLQEIPLASLAWAPDGTRLAFTASTLGDNVGTCLYLMSVIGGTPTLLTPRTDTAQNDCYLAWSPDGTRLAFISNRPAGPSLNDYVGHTNLWIMRIDGGTLTPVKERGLTTSDH